MSLILISVTSQLECVLERSLLVFYDSLRTTVDFTMASFKKLLGLGGDDKQEAASTSKQSSRAVSAEHQGPQPEAAEKASNMVPATLAERDEAAEDTTVCVRESEVRERVEPSFSKDHACRYFMQNGVLVSMC